MILFGVEIIADLAAALCIAGCAFMLASIYVVLTWKPGSPSRSGASRPASILKPVDGAGPWLFGRLASFSRQGYAGGVQLVLGALDDKGPGVGVAHHLKLSFPESGVAVVAGGREHGANR